MGARDEWAHAGMRGASELEDGVATYLREMGRRRLLTRDEEIRLAERVRAGDRQAAARLVEANLRLVVSIARRHQDRGVPFMDLVQEGNLGLMQAADGFDPSRGCRFSTYAYWCIRQAVRSAVAEQGRLVPMPAATLEAINRLVRVGQRLAQELAREPTDEELALELNTTTRRLAALRRLAQPPVSLELPADDGGAGSLLDLVVDRDRSLPPDDVVLDRLRVDVHAILAILTPRQRRVLQLRYGLLDGRMRTQEETGRRLGVTRQRICQIEKLALARLRVASGERALAGYLD